MDVVKAKEELKKTVRERLGYGQEYTDEDRNWRNEESRTFKEFKDLSIRPEIENEISLD